MKRSVKELPLCWYGIELLPKNVLDLAISLDLAIKDVDEETGLYSWGDTFYALREDFEEETGIRFELRDVWGASTGPSPDRKSTRLNSSHSGESRMPSSA